MALLYRNIVDDLGNPLGLAPQSLQVIATDGSGVTDVQTWKAITPTSDMENCWFTNNTASTATIEAGSTLLVHEDFRVGSSVQCWCY